MRDFLLLLSTPMVTLIFTVTFGVIWQRDRARVENLALGMGWLFLAIAMLVSQLSPSSLGRSLVAITHVPYTLSGVCIAAGILLRVNAAPPVRLYLSIGVVGGLMMAFSQAIGDSIKADLFITNVSSGVIMLLATQTFAMTAKRDGFERLMLITLIFVSAQFFIRPVMSFMFDGTIDPMQYRESYYYMALAWLFGFGSVLFGIVQLTVSMKDHMDALKSRTSIDDLSGLLARGEFEHQVKEAFAKASSKGLSVALVVCDLDHFKQVNDIWGHQVGDRAIAGFGSMIGNTVREADLAGRVGGEEFCILVWNATEDNAAGLSERLRQRTLDLDISEGALDVRLSASFGVAERAAGESYRSLFARADKAMYNAKQSGRNCVKQATSSGAEAATGNHSDASPQALQNNTIVSKPGHIAA
ncbi:GGDEF domain-containing protein [Erythrobacter sp. Alg231-14]|uniref:GGDEF domain-containing protein n=1 Tax=Erythrobacter sp. Alg231-14 TaxID=1922225 RepID=UPI00307C6428